jgi:enterochelin esterase-like enzyme
MLAQIPKVSSGSIKHFENFPSKYILSRNIDVWLPANYNAQKKYAVLYMQDGQMLFDSGITWNKMDWGVSKTLSKLMNENKIKGCIVVGIWNNGKYRHAEYFPQKALNHLSKDEAKEIMSLLIDTPRADDYLKFIVTELKPFIDSTFSTYKDQKHTFISGSSMGGLISLYAICEYPKVFGGAACMSTHWTGIFRASNNPVPFAILHYMKDNLPSPKDHKIYFDYGSLTLDSMYKTFQQKADEIMKAKGYTSANWETREFSGADHSERSWNKRFYIPVLFLLKQ